MEVQCLRDSLQGLLAMHDDELTNDDDIVYTTLQLVRRAHEVATSLLAEGRYIEAQRCLDACREATAVAATGGRNRSGSNSDMDMETVADTKDESVSGAEANTQGLDHSQEQEEEQPQGHEETEGELRLRGTPLASEIVRFQQSPPRPPPVHAVVEACLVPPAAASVEVPLEVEVQEEAAAVVALPPINAPSTEPPSRSPVMLVDPLDEPLCGTSMKGRMEEERSDFGDRRAATTRSTVVSFGKHEHWLSEDDTYLFNCLHERTQQLQRQITAAELSPPTIHPPRTTHYYMHKLGIVVDPLLAAQNAPIAPPDTVSMHPSVVADRKDHPQHPRLAPPPPERAINIGQRTKINEWKVRTRLPALVTGPVFLAPTSQPSSSSDDDEVKSAVAAIEDVRSEDGASRSNQDLEEEYSGVHSTEDRLGSSSPMDAASVAAAAGMTNAQMPPRPPLTSAALLPARRIFPTHVRPLSVDFAMSPNSLRSSSAASGDALDARGVPHLSTLRDASSGASTSSSPLCNGSLTTSIGNPKRSREVSDACTMRTALAIMHADEVLSRVTGTVDQVCTRGKTMLEEHHAIVARENRRRAALLRGMSHTNGPPAPAMEEPPVPSTVAVKKEVSIVSDDMAEASCSSVLHYFPQPSDGFTLSTGAETAVRDIKASFERKKEHAKTTTDVLHAIAASHDGRLNPEERKSTPVPPRLGTVKESSAGAYETPLSLTQRPLSVSHSDDGDGRLVVGCSTEGCSDAPLSFPSIHPAQASASSPKKGGPRPPRQPLSRSVSRRSSQPRELGSVAALMSSGVVGKKKEHSVVVADLISRLTDSSSYVFDDGVRSVILQHLEKEKAEAEVREGHKRFSYSQDASPPRLLNSPTTTDGLSSLALQNSGSIYTSCVMRSRVTNRILGARRSIGSFNPPVVPSTADPDHRRRGSCISSAFSISIGAEPRTMTVEADLSSRNGSSSVDRGGATDFVGRDCDPLHNAVLIQDDSYVPSLQELHLLRLPWTEVCPAILSNCLVVQLAAIRLQRIWRGFLARKLVDEHLVVLDLGREEEVRHDAAAIILQRFFRKRFAKRLYAVMQGRVAFMNEQRIESEKKRMTSTRSIRSADVEDESFPLFSEDAHGSTPTGNLSDAPITPATARSDSMPCFQVPYYLKGQFGGMQLKRIQRSVAARRIYLFYRQQKENAEVRQEREAYALLRYVTNQCTADEAFVSDLVEDATDEEALSAQPFAAALALHRYSYKDDLPPLPDLLRRYDGNILNLFDERMAERKHNGEYLVPLQHVSLRELERSKKFREDAALSEQKKQDRERQKAEEDQRRRERQCLEAVSIIQRVGRGFRWRMGLRRQFMKEEELHRHHPRRTEVRQRTLRRTNSMHNSQSTVSTYLVSAHELSAAESYLVPAAASMAIHRGISERHPQWFNHNVRDRMEQRTQLALLLQRFMMASQSQGAAFNKYLFAHAARIQRAWRRYRRRQHKKHTSHGTNNSPISPGSPRRRKKRVAVTFADEYHI